MLTKSFTKLVLKCNWHPVIHLVTFDQPLYFAYRIHKIPIIIGMHTDVCRFKPDYINNEYNNRRP